jgi:hypothetical protein
LNKHQPMRLFTFLSLSLLSLTSIAGNDTIPSTHSFKRMGFSLQAGPPVRILATEYIDEDANGLLPIGTMKRYAYSIGGAVRYHFTPNISVAARVAYVRRDFRATDTAYSITAESNDGLVHAMSSAANSSYIDYTMRNVLIGLGTSYEMPLGRMRIQGGLELAYIRYLQIAYNQGGAYYTIVNNDSLNNANDYNSLRVNSYYENATFPNVSSFGVIMHGGFEFMVCPNFGISTDILFGGFYTWTKNNTYLLSEGNSSVFTDSSNNNQSSTWNTEVNSVYTRKQFDFSPPTCVVGLNFYW